MTAEEDYKLLDFGIGFTNMVQRATKGSADLTRKEIKEGSRLLQDKLKQFRPKIAVFNGKLIFEVFSGKKDFNFGRQPECIEGTNTVSTFTVQSFHLFFLLLNMLRSARLRPLKLNKTHTTNFSFFFAYSICG